MTAEASSDLVAVHRAYDVQILDLKTMSNLGAIRNPLVRFTRSLWEGVS